MKNTLIHLQIFTHFTSLHADAHTDTKTYILKVSQKILDTFSNNKKKKTIKKQHKFLSFFTLGQRAP